MESINSRNNFTIMAKLFIVTIVGILLTIPTTESTFREVFSKLNFREEPGLLQFRPHNTPNSEDNGCNLILTYQTYILSINSRS
ncbi:hypothetical protein HanRHA438_Chr17g0837491 [Helianthus annuus]|nr:hypothetical protein HanRHA438_Chr17g0837491 [Helianthus annuus]